MDTFTMTTAVVQQAAMLLNDIANTVVPREPGSMICPSLDRWEGEPRDRRYKGIVFADDGAPTLSLHDQAYVPAGESEPLSVASSDPLECARYFGEISRQAVRSKPCPRLKGKRFANGELPVLKIFDDAS